MDTMNDIAAVIYTAVEDFEEAADFLRKALFCADKENLAEAAVHLRNALDCKQRAEGTTRDVLLRLEA